MANAFATNFPINASNDITSCLWKLTRVMKSAGWIYRASSNGAQKDTSGNPANDLWGTSANPQVDTYSAIVSTITTGTLALPASSSTLSVSSTTGFPTSGTINVATTSNGWQQLTYTGGGGGGTSFTGVNGGTGVVPTSAEVAPGDGYTLQTELAWWVGSGPQTIKFLLNAAPTGTPLRAEIVTQGTSNATAELIGYVWDTVGLTGWGVLGPQNAPEATTISAGSTNVTSGSNAVNINTFAGSGVINVTSTSGFAASGTLYVWTTGANAPYAVTYTGTSGGNQFTGCTSAGTGTMATGNPVLGAQVLPTGTLNVASTTGFPTAGFLQVMTSTGPAIVYYTGVSGGNSFTGCTTLATSFTGTSTAAITGYAVNGNALQFDGTHILTGAISGATLTPLGTTVTAASNTVNVNTFTTGSPGTLNVTSTTGFPAVGLILVTTNNGTAQITYTGITSTTFTGCTTAYSTAATPFSGTVSTTNAVQAAPVIYNREFMFGKFTSNNVEGDIYYICADTANESALLYSTLATSTGCTAVIWPGGGGTNNGFNTASPITGTPLNLVVAGVGGTTAGSQGIFGGLTNVIFGSFAQIACANNIPAATITADGSFYAAMSTSTANLMSGLVYTRLDDSEPGDLDPYVYCAVTGNQISNLTYSRTSVTSYSSSQYLFASGNWYNNSGTYTIANGYQARGNHAVIARDVNYGFGGSMLYSYAGANILQMNTTTGIRLVSHPAATPPLMREPFGFSTIPYISNSFKQYKGRARWIVQYSIGNCLDTYDSKTYICVMANLIANSAALALGPYDGVTSPTS